MSATIIDGKAFAARLRGKAAQAVQGIEAETGEVPGLAVVLMGADPASEIYVRSKNKMTTECGMRSFVHRLDADAAKAELLTLVRSLNTDPAVNGILVQLPLPGHVDANEVLAAIDPAKDVDGFHISNVGRLGTGQPGMVPCTPLGCLMLLKAQIGDLSGLNAVVLGRSNIVGKPMAQLLLGESCTVTIAHSRSRDLADITRRADILVTAVGRPEMVTGAYLKPGVTIVDVGINRVERDGKTRLVGDCHFASCAEVAGAMTPVPGGVGPMTIACLLTNTITAFCRARGMDVPDILTLGD